MATPPAAHGHGELRSGGAGATSVVVAAVGMGDGSILLAGEAPTGAGSSGAMLEDGSGVGARGRSRADIGAALARPAAGLLDGEGRTMAGLAEALGDGAAFVGAATG
jgi:hypothetical protein